ncbi:MAG: lipopolysaccharide biosynthesis protein, partial [Vicinamibacteria bacterium]
ILVFSIAPLVATVFGLAIFARRLASRTSERGAGRELFDYVRWFAATIIVGHIISRLDVLTLGWLAPMSEVGLFSGAQVFALVPQLTGTYAAVVIHPRIVPYCIAGTFRRFFVRTQSMLLLAAIATYLLVLFTWDTVAPRLLPDSFLRSGPILLIILPSALLGMATFPVALGYVMFVRKRFLVSLDFALFPVLLLLYYFVVPAHGAIGAAWVSMGAGIARSLAVIGAAWLLIDRAGDLKEPDVLEESRAEARL